MYIIFTVDKIEELIELVNYIWDRSRKIHLLQLLGVDANRLLGGAVPPEEDGQCREVLCRIRNLLSQVDDT